MGNAAGVFAVLAAFARPGIVVPHAIVPDIGEIDWERLRREGVEDVVIDKDNCITLPLKDKVAPGLESAWSRLTKAGFRSILIVSNSAGSSDDPLAIGAEHLARTLGQTVLAHPAKKPAMACAKQILDVLAQPQKFDRSFVSDDGSSKQRLIAVVGDRVTTDVILASRLNILLNRRGTVRGGPTAAVGILTTRVLEPERMMTRLMRSAEMWCLARLERRGFRPGDGWRSPLEELRLSGPAWQDIAHDEQIIRRATELEAASQIRPDMREVFLLKSQELVSRSLWGLGRLTKISAVFLARTVFRLASHLAYLASRGRIGAPSSLPSLPMIRRRPSLPSAFTRTSAKPMASSRRPFTTAHASRIRHAHTNATRNSHPSVRPRFTAAQKFGYFSALILLPTCWYGGFYLNDYLALRQTRKQEEVTGHVEHAVDLHDEQRQPFTGPQSAKVPSLANAAASTSTQHAFEIQSLKTERLHATRELADLDDKLARIRQRQGKEV